MYKKSRSLFNILGALPLLFSFLVSAAPAPSACLQAGPIGISPSTQTVSMSPSGTATVTYTFTNNTSSASFQLGTLTPTLAGDTAHISASVTENTCTQPLSPTVRSCTQTVTLTSQQALSNLTTTLNVQICDTHTPNPIFCSKTSTCNVVNISVANTVAGTIYVGTASGNVYYSTNNGTTWTITAAKPPNNPADAIYGIFKTSDALYVTTSTGIFRSADNGANWTDLNFPPPPAPARPQAVFVTPETGNNYTIYGTTFDITGTGDVAFNPANTIWTTLTPPETNDSASGIFRVGTTLYVSIAFSGNVYTSIDNGTIWTATTAQPDPGSGANGIFVTSNGTIYVASNGNTVAISNTNGSSWTLTSSPDATPVTGVAVNALDSIYASTLQGNVAFSTNNGASWQFTIQPEPGVPVTAISLG